MLSYLSVIQLVIYIDVLFALNLIVNYFLLRTLTLIERVSPPLLRILGGAAAGAAGCAALFFPPMGFLPETAMRLALSALPVLCTFGFKCGRVFLRRVALLFAVSFGYAGLMTAIWFIFKPQGMAISNQVVYFNISPLLLISLTTVCYCLLKLILMLARRTKPPERLYNVELQRAEHTVSVTALLDTGNSLRDLYGGCYVVIVDEGVALRLLDCDRVPQLCGATLGVPQAGCTEQDTPDAAAAGFRLLPFSTVSGSGGFLVAFKTDRLRVFTQEGEFVCKNAVAAISKTALDGEYSAIIGEDIASQIQ